MSAGARTPEEKEAFRVSRVHKLMKSICLIVLSVLGLSWNTFTTPTLFSMEIKPGYQPQRASNDPAQSVYLGQGCFWHTQYDFVVIEQQQDNNTFGGRSDAQVTSLVGYAGGRYTSGTAKRDVCYHGLAHTDYNRLGHAEAVGVQLDGWQEAGTGSGGAPGPDTLLQFNQLVKFFFSHGYTANGDGQMGRLDPGDRGPEYRSIIGIPGGVQPAGKSPLYDALLEANVHGMTISEGKGGPPHGDDQGEYVVYVYDSVAFPFFRAETYHQFHTNDVLQRAVPSSYTRTLKSVQEAEGRMSSTGCPEGSYLSFFSLLLTFGLFVLMAWACCMAYQALFESSESLRPAKTHGGAIELQGP